MNGRASASFLATVLLLSSCSENVEQSAVPDGGDADVLAANVSADAALAAPDILSILETRQLRDDDRFTIRKDGFTIQVENDYMIFEKEGEFSERYSLTEDGSGKLVLTDDGAVYTNTTGLKINARLVVNYNLSNCINNSESQAKASISVFRNDTKSMFCI